MVTISTGLNKRRRHRPRRDTWCLLLVSLLLFIPSVFIYITYNAFVKTTTTMTTSSIVIANGKNSAAQRDCITVNKETAMILLTNWNGASPSGQVFNNHTMLQYGRNPLIGSYSYEDEFGCARNDGCQIHFPFIDLKTMILQGEAVEIEDAVVLESTGIDSPEHDPPMDSYNATDKFPPAVYVPKRMASFPESTPRLSYKNFALLTRCGDKDNTGGGATVNQDRLLLVSPFSIPDDSSKQRTVLPDIGSNNWLMGLFDGHGSHGHTVSHFCAVHVARILAKRVQHHQRSRRHGVHDALDMRLVLTETILELDRTVPLADLSGATGIVMWHWGNQIAVANTGDSYASIVRYNPFDRSLDILYTTQPHKPDSHEERERIEQLGGQVQAAPLEGGSSRVVIPANSEGIIATLAMSRSIGDHGGRSIGVIANPTVDVLDTRQLVANHTSQTRLFALALSDGLLDFVPEEQILRHVAESLFPDSSDANDTPPLLESCEQLIMKASQRWRELVGSYRDDISIAVTTLT